METIQATSCWSQIVKNKLPPKQHQESISNRVLENCISGKGVAIAVVDANALIHGGETLTNCADRFVSVKEALEEVKDPVARRKLDFVPFTVETIEPSEEALRKVVNFARATGDLQTLSDVDIKLIALAYTLEIHAHGTKHLKERPPPLNIVNVKKMPEKDMPGWGTNVPNLEEWEALEKEVVTEANPDSRILSLKDLNLNSQSMPEHIDSEHGSIQIESIEDLDKHEDSCNVFKKPLRYFPPRKEVDIESKKIVATGIDASHGEIPDNASDWRPAVSRSTHRRYLKRQARRETSKQRDQQVLEANNIKIIGNDCDLVSPTTQSQGNLEGGQYQDETSEDVGGELLIQLKHITIGNNSSEFHHQEEVPRQNHLDNEIEIHTDVSSEIDGNTLSTTDDTSSEQNWMLQSLSESTVACITGDYAMQNVILQMGLRLLAPNGMQIRQLHRWVLKCHACNKVTIDVGKVFCPKCGNGGTLRKVSVTVNEDGVLLSSRRPRITLRGTKFSLPLPQGGREAITKNLILREDQLPSKLLYPKTKKKSSNQEDDFSCVDDLFSHPSNKKAPLKPPVRKSMVLFSGRRNPNDNHFARRMHY